MKSFKEYLSEDVSKQDLQTLEKKLDNLFNKAGLDIEFTKHFLDRVNDGRNGEQITIDELKKLYDAEYEKYAKIIASRSKNFEAVLNDISSDINVPFVLKWNKEKRKLDLIAKTIMRKKEFKSRNQKYKVKT